LLLIIFIASKDSTVQASSMPTQKKRHQTCILTHSTQPTVMLTEVTQ